jgi:Uma2 family endonuclease
MSVAAVGASGEQRFRLSLVSWEKYEQMAAWLDGRHVRLTYDRGELELRNVSYRHERCKHLLRRVVDTVAFELDIEIHGAGSMTFMRKDLERALEPDECYWVEHEPQMRCKEDYDQLNDPPPDLVLEVEVSRSVLNRMGIYAAMKVPEVWRWDGQELRFCLLKKDRYEESTVSRFAQLEQTLSDTKLLRAFRQWVREQQAQGWPTAPAKPPKGKPPRSK